MCKYAENIYQLYEGNLIIYIHKYTHIYIYIYIHIYAYSLAEQRSAKYIYIYMLNMFGLPSPGAYLSIYQGRIAANSSKQRQMAANVRYYQTSFRSPIGSRSEVTQQFSRGSAQNRGTILFGLIDKSIKDFKINKFRDNMFKPNMHVH